jgi:hypothetical protein
MLMMDDKNNDDDNVDDDDDDDNVVVNGQQWKNIILSINRSLQQSKMNKRLCNLVVFRRILQRNRSKLKKKSNTWTIPKENTSMHSSPSDMHTHHLSILLVGCLGVLWWMEISYIFWDNLVSGCTRIPAHTTTRFHVLTFLNVPILLHVPILKPLPVSVNKPALMSLLASTTMPVPVANCLSSSSYYKESTIEICFLRRLAFASASIRGLILVIGPKMKNEKKSWYLK